jgi:mRNA interferase MazF
MVKREYVPEKGDFVWVNFSPQVGHEQAGLRPALVLTDSEYNAKTGLMIACPITKHAKGYPFEIALPKGSSVFGVVLADHVKSLDWRGRKAEFKGKAHAKVIAEVIDTLGLLIGNEA